MDQIPEALRQEMRCPYMGGEFPFPVKYGYSLVGKVVQGPESHLGKLVHVLHPHQDRCVVAVEDLAIVPENVPAARATLASNLETAVTAVWDSRVGVGDRVLVVGFGVVGSLIARLLSSIAGVSLTVVDVSPGKLRMAQEMGFEAREAHQLEGGFDLAFHASGDSDGLQSAVDFVGYEGRVIEVSWYGSRPVNIHLGGTFHSQRKSIVSSQVSNIPSHLRGRWDHRRRKALVFELLKDASYDAHLTHATPFDKLPDFFTENLADPPDGLAQLVNFN
jgi:threonine dehydrogenase-like Zn-dependent dehydrogenase